jgi:NIPSNAP
MNMNKNLTLLTTIILCLFFFSASKEKREWFEFKIYALKTPFQEKRVDDYLKNAYIPAMHRLGLSSIGVFKPIETDTTVGKKVYVLIAYPTLQKFSEVQSALNKDQEYLSNGKDYIDATHDNVTFSRIESILMKSFSKSPTLQRPKLTGRRIERVYELRSYEGPTEKRFENKVKMFNDGDEVGLFARLNFNAVFYGEVFAGSHMPNLMYMTTFDNMQSRDEHWKAFVADPQWEKLKAMPEYQNNVSKNTILFLRPTEYSDY